MKEMTVRHKAVFQNKAQECNETFLPRYYFMQFATKAFYALMQIFTYRHCTAKCHSVHTRDFASLFNLMYKLAI